MKSEPKYSAEEMRAARMKIKVRIVEWALGDNEAPGGYARPLLHRTQGVFVRVGTITDPDAAGKIMKKLEGK